MSEIKKTVGQVADEKYLSESLEDNPIEYRKAMEPEIIQNIWDAINKAKDHTLYVNRDFYVVLLMKWERAIKNAPRTYAFVRRSCPTPTYKQAVWKYHHASHEIEFLWSLPDALMYYYLINNIATIPKEQHQLAQFCILNEEGKLLEWVKKENGEKKDAVIRINAPEREALA